MVEVDGIGTGFSIHCQSVSFLQKLFTDKTRLQRLALQKIASFKTLAVTGHPEPSFITCAPRLTVVPLGHPQRPEKQAFQKSPEAMPSAPR